MLLLLQGCGGDGCPPSELPTDEKCKSPDGYGGTDCGTCSKAPECMICAEGYTAVPGQTYFLCDACGMMQTYTCKEHNITKTDDTKCSSQGGDCLVVPDEEMTCKDGYTPQL